MKKQSSNLAKRESRSVVEKEIDGPKKKKKVNARENP